MKQAIVYDWDDVIVDATLLKDEIFRIIGTYVDETAIQTVYNTTKDENGFSPRGIARYIATLTTQDETRIYNAIQAAINQSHAFVYEDARSMLQELAVRDEYDTYILTAGNKDIQTAKLVASELQPFILNHIVVPAMTTAQSKASELARIAQQYDTVYFFDDKLTTIVHMHEQFRHTTAVRPIWVDRKHPMRPNAVTNGYVTHTISLDLLHAQDMFFRRQRVLASTLLATAHRSVLMMKEVDESSVGIWSLPISHVNPHETYGRSIIRETLAKTGYTISTHPILTDLYVIDGAIYGSDQNDSDKALCIALYTTPLDPAQRKSSQPIARWHKQDELNHLTIRGALWQQYAMSVHAK